MILRNRLRGPPRSGRLGVRRAKSAPVTTALLVDVAIDGNNSDPQATISPAIHSALLNNPLLAESVLHAVFPDNGDWIQIQHSVLMGLLGRLPRLTSLTLTGVYPDYVQRSTLQYSGASLGLRRLVIRLSGMVMFASATFFRVLVHLPHLRDLEVGCNEGACWPTPWPPPALPFSLDSFVYSGLVCGRACAHVINASRHTLRALDIINHRQLSDETFRLIIPAILDVAPVLRTFSLSIPSSGVLDEHIGSLIPTLARCRLLRVAARTQVALWRVARAAGPAIAGDLKLSCTLRPDDVEDVPADVLSILCAGKLRTLALSGFSISDESADELLRRCRQHRVRCSLLNRR